VTSLNYNHQGYEPTSERSSEDELGQLHEIFGHGERLHSSERVMDSTLEAEEAMGWLADQVAREKLQGKYTALVAGGFDVPHDNHEWYIRHCRMLVARRVLEQEGKEAAPGAIMDIMTSGRLALIVSIDSDEALNARKGGVSEKGGIPRPIYPWESRAHRIAGYSFQNPATGAIHHTADIVTKECSVHYHDTPLQQAATTVEWLKSLDLLDSYAIFDEHPQDEANARALGFDPIIVSQDIIYARDHRNGRGFKSSGIIKAIRGEN
jgi:hypothetical protein